MTEASDMRIYLLKVNSIPRKLIYYTQDYNTFIYQTIIIRNYYNECF